MSGFLDTMEILFFVALALLAVAALISARGLAPPVTPPFARRAATGSSSVVHPDNNAGFLRDRGFMFTSRLWFTATCCPPHQVKKKFYDHVVSRQWREPVRLLSYGPRTWWMFEGNTYWEAAGYTAQDILALIRDRERRQRDKLDRAHR